MTHIWRHFYFYRAMIDLLYLDPIQNTSHFYLFRCYHPSSSLRILIWVRHDVNQFDLSSFDSLFRWILIFQFLDSRTIN